MYIRKKLLVSIQLSNKILLFQVKTQLLKVINYYCLPDFCPGLQKIFFYFLNTIAVASTQSQAQAEIQSQAQAEAQAAAAQLPGSGLNSNNL